MQKTREHIDVCNNENMEGANKEPLFLSTDYARFIKYGLFLFFVVMTVGAWLVLIFQEEIQKHIDYVDHFGFWENIQEKEYILENPDSSQLHDKNDYIPYLYFGDFIYLARNSLIAFLILSLSVGFKSINFRRIHRVFQWPHSKDYLYKHVFYVIILSILFTRSDSIFWFAVEHGRWVPLIVFFPIMTFFIAVALAFYGFYLAHLLRCRMRVSNR